MTRKRGVGYGEITGPVANDNGRFAICPRCKRRFDTRDLRQVLDHAGRLPHPVPPRLPRIQA